MELREPWLLLLLLLVPVVIAFRYKRRRTTVLFGNGTTLRHLRNSPAVALQPLLPFLYGIGLALLVVALARPQKGLDESIVRTDAVDIVLLVDVSTSMLAEDLAEEGVNRLEAAKKVIEKFVKRRTNDRIGMVAFAGLPYSISPLTMDQAWLIDRITLPTFKPGMLPQDGTAIGSAIASGVNRLRESEAKSKLIILLTDGINNAGTLSPENAAQAAKALDIKVYTIAAGSDGPARVPVQTMFGTRYQMQDLPIDEKTLQEIANITGAEYFRATNLKSLEKVYEQIDEMETTAIEVEQFTRFEEAFMPFLAWGLLFLAIEKVLALTRLGRLP